MLCLSRTTGHAIQALSYLMKAPGAFQRTAEIARGARVPKPYLAKIFQALARKGIVRSRRGIGGGVVLARHPQKITLLDIVEAVEGPDWIGSCLLNLHDCATERVCPTHSFWQRIRGEIVAQLRTTTLAQVIAYRQNEGAPPGRTCCSKPRPARAFVSHRHDRTAGPKSGLVPD